MTESEFKPFGLSKFILIYHKIYDSLLITKSIRWISEQILFYVLKFSKTILKSQVKSYSEINTIHMVIRHLPILEGRNNPRHKGQRPNWFDYNNCFDSLFTSIKTIPNERLKIKILFDGDRNDFYQDILYKYTEKFENIDVVYINGGSEMASGIILHNYIKSLKLPGEDLIYFVENDYLHSKNWYHQFMQFNNLIKDWGFVTLFNHPNEIPINIIQIDSMKWGEIYSTTGTYIVKAGVYNQLSLYYKLLRKDYRFFKIACRGIGFKMFTPIPTLAQHAMKGDISPTFDLENFKNQD